MKPSKPGGLPPADGEKSFLRFNFESPRSPVSLMVARVHCAQLLAQTAGKPLIMEEFGVTHNAALAATLPYPSRETVFAR
jgi:hypothetical protein